MDAKARTIEQLISKFEKRALELDKDASRLGLINKPEVALDIKAAVELIQSAIFRLKK